MRYLTWDEVKSLDKFLVEDNDDAVGIEIHKIIIYRVHVLSFEDYLVVKVRASTLSRVAAECNLLPADNLLTFLYKEFHLGAGLPFHSAAALVCGEGFNIHIVYF